MSMIPIHCHAYASSRQRKYYPTPRDHQISCNISIDLPPKTTLSRQFWQYSEADREGLNTIGKHI